MMTLLYQDPYNNILQLLLLWLSYVSGLMVSQLKKSISNAY